MNSVGFLRLAFFSPLLGLLFLPFSQSAISDEVLALNQIKKAIFDDPLSHLSDWNADDADPCDWSAVVCSSARDHVISLDLSNSSLEGFIAPEVGSLKFLQELILRGNSLRGVIPKEIGMMKSLTVLDLSSNRLSGSIPPEIGSLERLTKINLQSNSLTGALPLELGKLSNLVELRLDKNKLQGSINGSGGLCLCRGLKIANFSFNFFVGKVPSCLDYLPRTSFIRNCFQNESIPQRLYQQCANHQLYIKTTARDSRYKFDINNSGQPRWLLILEIFTGIVVLLFIITLICTAIKKLKPKRSLMIFPWKKPEKSRDLRVITGDGEMLKHVPAFSRQQLEIACEDFSNIIGSSTAIILYKGTMSDGPEIAAISLTVSDNDWATDYEIRFQKMVADLARVNHENIAKLLGYCKEEKPFTRMLVFEYASNGTLYEYLHYGEGCQLFWTRRMKIAIGIARGLRHLHNELQPPFIVSDLNSSAIHLTDDFSPKIADIESWKLMLARPGKNMGFQKKADTLENLFSFGVILLEIISGRPPYCKDRGNLINWAVEYLEKPDMMCHLVDPELRYFKHDDLRVLCNAVSLCIQSEPSKRPSMKEICAMMENVIDTSAAADLKESPLAWAELVLSS